MLQLVEIFWRNDRVPEFDLGKSLAISRQTFVVALDKALHVYEVATSTPRFVIPIDDSMKSKGFRIQQMSLDGNIVAASLSNGMGGQRSHHCDSLRFWDRNLHSLFKIIRPR